MDKKEFIGVFDSGVGGITVLRSLVQTLPSENFVYFGDSANAPYGEKSMAEVRGLSMNIIDRFVNRGAKAVVIACNKATSASAEYARKKYPDLPIIGVEPAVKPAAVSHDRILIMATEMTLKLDKFHHLLDSLEGQAKFYPVACTGLAARIEKGNLDGEDLMGLLHGILDPWRGKVDSIVLGCTHYPYVREQIREVMGEQIPMYDGADGTARHLAAELTRLGKERKTDQSGQVTFESSLTSREELELYEAMFSGL